MLLIALAFAIQGFSASTISSTPATLKGAKLDINVENPFGQGTPRAFSDGKDQIFVDVEALDGSGGFLRNEPLVVEKPNAIKILGPQNTDSGSFKWALTSTEPIKAKVTIKLANRPVVKKSFTVNFSPNFSISNQTDKGMFVMDKPVTFTAKVDPSMVRGLGKSYLIYSYRRRFNKWGAWFSRRQQTKIPLLCSSDGYCRATVPSDDTKYSRNKSGEFQYTFLFIDKAGRQFSKTYSGKLNTLGK